MSIWYNRGRKVNSAMTAVMLSKRLMRIARACPVGARVADIGSDHALLASYLAQNGIASQVIAGEVNEGPYQAARRQVERLGLPNVSVRKGDGLSVLAPGEADVICIAGMGGQLIVSILEAGKSRLEGVRKLILQPNVGEETVRRWLLYNGWELVEEAILEEDGIIYEILVAEPGDPEQPYRDQDRTMEDLLRIGPHLWREKSPVLYRKWRKERDKTETILKQMSRSEKPEVQERIDRMKQELLWMDEVIACLPTDKP